ncbi:MAG: cell envelope integrity protein TolA [Betaproteobacteria bacterium]|nr:cell envelope integrity protein TolA [Betaproteobacteria bacterium]
MKGGSNTSGDRAKARFFALAMHALFILLIVFGVSWQKKPETPVQAELWSNLPPLPQAAPPKVAEPPPQPPPPAPTPRVTPPPPPKIAPTPAPKPDIALKKAPEKKAEPKPEAKPAPKAEPKKREDDKVALLKKAEEERAKREREQEAQRELAEKQAREAAEAKLAAEKAAAERAAKAAAQREMQKYVAGIYSKVWARVAVPSDIQGNPEAVFTVSLLPGGELQNVEMTRSSGNAAYDAAIERAIRQAQPFVVPTGDDFHRNFRRFPMVFRPKS